MRSLAECVRPDWKSRFHRFHLILSKKQKLVFHTIHRFSKVLFNEDWKVWESRITGEGPESLLIFSEDDQLFGTSHAEWLTESLGGEAHFLPDGQHMVMRTSPDVVYKLMAQFLEKEEEPLVVESAS